VNRGKRDGLRLEQRDAAVVLLLLSLCRTCKLLSRALVGLVVALDRQLLLNRCNRVGTCSPLVLLRQLLNRVVACGVTLLVQLLTLLLLLV